MTMQAQRRAKKTVSAMMVLVLRNEDDDDAAAAASAWAWNRTGTVSSTAISGILWVDLAFTKWVFGELEMEAAWE